MLQSLGIGIGLTVGLVLAWVLVQALWRNAFREEYLEDDVLAGRRSCSNCGCTGICEKEQRVIDKSKNGLLDQKIIKDHL